MTTFDWSTHGMVTTQESTVLVRDDQQLWEIWTIETLDTGAFIPKRLGDQLAGSFAEAVQGWAEMAEVEAFLDPLTLTYNGMPLIESRKAAADIVQRYRQNGQ